MTIEECPVAMPGGRRFVTVWRGAVCVGAYKEDQHGRGKWRLHGEPWRHAPGYGVKDGARGFLMAALDAMEVE